jgi:hypothetical protein
MVFLKKEINLPEKRKQRRMNCNFSKNAQGPSKMVQTEAKMVHSTPKMVQQIP